MIVQNRILQSIMVQGFSKALRVLNIVSVFSLEFLEGLQFCSALQGRDSWVLYGFVQLRGFREVSFRDSIRVTTRVPKQGLSLGFRVWVQDLGCICNMCEVRRPLYSGSEWLRQGCRFQGFGFCYFRKIRLEGPVLLMCWLISRSLRRVHQLYYRGLNNYLYCFGGF